MILAQKIIKLRKQFGWSQEDLAEKMAVSRQSVSKWESANSIPDLNKIIAMTEIFGVSTDFLLKDEIESDDVIKEDKEADVPKVSLEQATGYVENKVIKANLTLKGVMLCVCSVVPLFLLLAFSHSNPPALSGNAATALGLVLILLMISFGVGFFIKAGQDDSITNLINSGRFELSYGVHGVFIEKLKKYKNYYNVRVSISIALFILSSAPLIVVSLFFDGTEIALMMLIILILMITAGLYLIIPVSAKYEAFNRILMDGDFDPEKRKEMKKAMKLALFYWPLLTAIFLGWSLWTMNWGVTWIIWPVGAVLFASLVGLMALLEKEEQ